MGWLARIFLGYLYPPITTSLYRLIDLLPATTRISQWKKARRNISAQLPPHRPHQKYLLIFCPSLGEYDSIRTVISRLKRAHQDIFIEVVFFSSSGYVPLQDVPNPEFDWVSYSPLDTRAAVHDFFSKRAVSEVLISSLAIWPIFLEYLVRHNVPYSFAGVTMRKGFLKHLYYHLLSDYLTGAKYLFAIEPTLNQEFATVLSAARIVTCGDPRIDSIRSQLEHPPALPLLEAFKSNQRVIIFGSTHRQDEVVIFPIISACLDLGFKILMAPHDISRAVTINQQLEKSILYSNYDQGTDVDILIIDQMGILKYSYVLCDISYVGGGFSEGLHNIVEPLLSDSTVIIGPNYSKSHIAPALINANAIIRISDSNEMLAAISQYSKREYREASRRKRQDIFEDLRGADEVISDMIFS